MFALIVLVYVALPALVRYGLPHALAPYGIESSVEGARVNLMNEQVTLVGFQVGQAGGPAIRWGEVTARVDMAELLKGNIRIIDFEVKDAKVDLAQLRASKWVPPESATAIPDLDKLNVDIGNVVLRDLEFIGLSEQVGQKVRLQSLSVGSLSHLEAGERVAFQLDGVIGNASLRLAGLARMAENLPAFDGRYELGGLDLKGFGHLFGLATPGSIGGRVDGDGTFDLTYLQGEGVIRANLSGSARVVGLELDSAQTRVTRTTAEWNGDSQVFWPVAGEPPRLTARGSFISPSLEAARETSGAPVGILLAGLQWNGELRHGSQLAIEGMLSGDLLRINSGHEGEARFRMELSHVSADSKYGSGRGWYEFNAAKLSAERADLSQALDGGSRSATASRLLLENLVFGGDSNVIGRLEVESAEATMTRSAAVEPSHSLKFIRLGATGIEMNASGGARIGEVEAAQTKIDFEKGSVELSKARSQNVKISTDTPFGAETLSVSSLRQQTGDFDTRGSDLLFSGASLSASGEVFSDEAAAASLSQTKTGDSLWEANTVQASGLSIGPERIESGKLRAGHFAYGKAEGDPIEIDRGEATEFLIQYDAGIDAGRLTADALRYRSGRIAALELEQADLNAPGITFNAELSAKHLDATRARYVDPDANVSVLDSLNLGEISGDIATGLRIDGALAKRLSLDRAAGADYHATGLEFGRMEFSTAGNASSSAGRLATLEVELSEGARLTLEDVAAVNPVRVASGIFAADSGSVGKLSYSMPGERVLNIIAIDVGAIEGAEANGHRIKSLSAVSAQASDPAAYAKLLVGALEIEEIKIEAAGGVQVERVSAMAVSLNGFEGDPAASFSSAGVRLNGPDLKPGERLSLGDVVLDHVDFTMGLDDQGEFLLPVIPFLSGDQESPVGLAIRRLETRQAARMEFFDRSTSPPFKIAISPIQARLENFHSSDPGYRTRFTLEGSVDEFSTVKASGEFSLERDGLDLGISGKISAFELNRLNMYAAKYAKRAIRSGRGDAAFDIAVRSRKLSGNIQFVFSKVIFEPTVASTVVEEQNPEELSLQNSFAMLKDQNGIVRLTVPLSGSLDDPKFDFSDGLVQAIIKALRSTVMLTFKPLGLLVTATGLITGSEGLEFNPLAFGPGEETLSGEGLAHLDTLARELKSHPGVEMRICGRAVSADRISIEQRRRQPLATTQAGTGQEAANLASVDEVLAKLAEARASAVRRYLQENKQIAPERLLECAAKVETTPGRLPRVDLRIRVETQSKPSTNGRTG